MAHPIMSSAIMTGPDTANTLPVFSSFGVFAGAIFSFTIGFGGGRICITGVGVGTGSGSGGGVELARVFLGDAGDAGSGIWVGSSSSTEGEVEVGGSCPASRLCCWIRSRREGRCFRRGRRPSMQWQLGSSALVL